jgi:Mrp family chromosome partitioning ATPase
VKASEDALLKSPVEQTSSYPAEPVESTKSFGAEAARSWRPHVVVVGNHKGGSGKSTIAMHIIVALLKAGKRVASIDLDLTKPANANPLS